MLKDQIQALASRYAEELINIRRHLHAHPELSYQEYNTSSYIQNYLAALHIPFKVLANTGVVAMIEAPAANGKAVALRADMDALPITEANDVPYKSLHPGVMHACGHDVHTTCLLGAAKILNEIKEHLKHSIKLIFQPGEERNPGGASLLIKEGVLHDPAPQAIVALHVHPQLPVGKLSFREGKVMASADEIYITIRGEGGHAAAPQLTADTVLIASHIIVSLQQIISRNNHPLTPSVLSICAINGGNTTNVIPSEVKLMGTFRAMDEEWRFKAHKLIKEQVIGIARAMGADADVHIDVGYPVVMNDARLTQSAKRLAEDYLGSQNVEETEVRMGAEDFGFYTQHIPGCFFRLGVRNEAKGIVNNVHTPRFDVDESALVTGAGIMAYLGASLNIHQ